MHTQKNSIADTQISQLITQEHERQNNEINLIASENYASQAILDATGSVLTNKYAEGYAGARYYAGCAVIDEIEKIAITRCKKLFNAEHVNVQPHAGSQANLAVYTALLNPGDTILGMNLAAGGHLTHGHSVNISGKLFNAIQYSVNPKTGLLDYNEIEKIARAEKPHLIIAGASAYSRTIDFERFAQIAQSVGAFLLADIAHIAGLIAAGVHPNPFPHADVVTSTTHKTLRGPRGGLIMCKKELAKKIDRAIMPGTQGGPLMHVVAAKAIAFKEALHPEFTCYQKQVIANAQAMVTEFKKLDYTIVADGTDNHLFIIDLRNKNITGIQAERALTAAGITVNRSCIPFDPQKPWITSGIRIGTPAITTRGMQEETAQQITSLINEALMNHEDLTYLAKLKEKTKQLCLRYPIAQNYFRFSTKITTATCEKV